MSPNDEDLLSAWETLEEEGGVLIVDAISLYHPQLRRTVLESQLIGSNNGIAVIVIPPNGADRIKDILEKKIYTSCLRKAFARYTNQLNPYYVFSVSDLHDLLHKLSHIFEDITGNPRLNQRQRDAIHKEMGFPRGWEDWIFRKDKA